MFKTFKKIADIADVLSSTENYTKEKPSLTVSLTECLKVGM